MRVTWVLIGATLLAVAFIGGCGTESFQPVSAEDFYGHSVPEAPRSQVDQPGSITYPGTGDGVVKPRPRELKRSNETLAEAVRSDDQLRRATAIGPTTSPTRGPSAKSTTQSSNRSIAGTTTMPSVALFGPTTEPSTRPANPSTAKSAKTPPVLTGDQYMILGTVVATVYDQPIYANKVLDDTLLPSLAKQDDLAHFEIDARHEIERNLQILVNNELEVVAAERTLDPKDIQLARVLTNQWRTKEINEAGGSEEVARLRAKEAGKDFGDLEVAQYRTQLQRVYYYKKILPLIEVSADDERRYYNAHLSEFTSKTEASIILIEADPDKMGGDTQGAIQKLEDIRIKTAAWADFAIYGQTKNDLPGAMGENGNGGVHVIEPNSFILSKVEEQVWKIPVGSVSDVIQDQGGVYIFKLVSRELGGVKPFSNRAVQDAIKRKLQDAQFVTLRDAEIAKLNYQEAAPPPSPEMIDAAVGMAMQNYPRWAKGE